MSRKRLPAELINQVKADIRAGLPRGDIRERWGNAAYARAAKGMAPGRRGRPVGLSRDVAAAILAKVAAGASAADLAREHGISKTTVASLVERQDMTPFVYPPELAALEAIDLDDAGQLEVARLKEVHRILAGMLAKNRIADEKVRGPGSP